ncbi:MAG: hypothetical protein PVS2B3_12880 [Steroidobacteraceae bacterium]
MHTPQALENIMIDRNFDPSSLLNNARDAFAPVLKAQQEGFKSLERLVRLQYAVAGDLLDSGLARVNATLSVSSPMELFSKQGELNSQFVDMLRTRAQEFATVTSEIQAQVSQLGSHIAAKAVPAKKAA